MMPELPEVETTRRGLAQHVIGARIEAVTVRRYDLRVPVPRHLARALTGCTITAVRRRAKYLLMDLDSGDVLLAHLGMSGSFTLRPARGFVPKTHDHLIIKIKNKDNYTNI
jgi:formamidopyrimidine-DNA glycosylase